MDVLAVILIDNNIFENVSSSIEDYKIVIERSDLTKEGVLIDNCIVTFAILQ